MKKKKRKTKKNRRKDVKGQKKNINPEPRAETD